jgi:hypothetical protein
VHLKVFYALVHDKVPRPVPLQARDRYKIHENKIHETDKTHKQDGFRILAGVAPKQMPVALCNQPARLF